MEEINSIIKNYVIYDEIKDQISISNTLKKRIDENRNDFKYVNRLILDELFSDSIAPNSINKKILDLQSSSYYNHFIKELKFAASLEPKKISYDDINVSKLISNVKAIKNIYQSMII
jgi:hypothetical protein